MKDGHDEVDNGSPHASEGSLEFYWKQFNDEFATEADCLEELYRRAGEEGLLKCRCCGSTAIRRKYGDRVGRCLSCKRKTWITAGTFFRRIRAARPWLAAIWLMEHGVGFSSLRFQTLVDIAYSSALSIFKKLTTVIQNQMGEDAVAVPSACFSRLVCRRSRETPARAHPISEEAEIERKREMEQKRKDQGTTGESSEPGVPPEGGEPAAAASGPGASDSEVDCDVEGKSDGMTASRLGEEVDDESAAGLSEQERKVYGYLSAKPIHFDDLYERAGVPVGELSACLMMLELAGMARRMPGDWYVSRVGDGKGDVCGNAVQSGSSIESSVEATEEVLAIIRFVREGFHGISRKYLQQYLAAYWCRVDRVRWQSKALLRACLRSRCISYDELLDYVSPVMVKIAS